MKPGKNSFLGLCKHESGFSESFFAKRLFTSFSRRVDEDYIIPKGCRDDLVAQEGLHPCTVIPAIHKNEQIAVIYNESLSDLTGPGSLENNFNGFIQTVRERYLVPEKSRLYYSRRDWLDPEKGWMADESPEGLYPTLILPEELVGVVVLIAKKVGSRNEETWKY